MLCSDHGVAFIFQRPKGARPDRVVRVWILSSASRGEGGFSSSSADLLERASDLSDALSLFLRDQRTSEPPHALGSGAAS